MFSRQIGLFLGFRFSRQISLVPKEPSSGKVLPRLCNNVMTYFRPFCDGQQRYDVSQCFCDVQQWYDVFQYFLGCVDHCLPGKVTT
jgi:hypothetical protein